MTATRTTDSLRPLPMVLASHALCPYVQRAAIVAEEKGIRLERRTVDLSDKPGWFVDRSPTGKVPLLMVGADTLFESSAIAEYLDEISGGGLLPADPLERARVRGWTQFASDTLADIARLYNAPDRDLFASAANAVDDRLGRVADAVRGPWFSGATFGLVDAAFAPVFRYLDAFASIGVTFGDGVAAAVDWRARLRRRPSVVAAVDDEFPQRLLAFLANRPSHIGQRFRDVVLEPVL